MDRVFRYHSLTQEHCPHLRPPMYSVANDEWESPTLYILLYLL
jgi:hypothetical protein